MTFWGLRVTSGKSYKQTVLNDYKVTQAVLDISTVTSNEIISLQVDVNGSSFLLCNLSLDHGILQVPLECPFSEGEAVTFLAWSNSESEKAVVHLTGYIKESSPSAKVSNGECPLTNVTNIKAKNLKSSINRIHKNEYSVKKDKENESPEENKQTNSKSEDKKTSQKNKKSKPDKKEVSLKDMLNTINVDDEDEDDEDEEYSPEEEEAENEMLDEDDEDDTDDDDDDDDDEDTDEDLEKEITLEEEEEENDDDDQINNDTVEIEDMEEDLKENTDEEDEILKDLPKKKKRRLSSSSAGRTPIPKSSKKPKIQDLSGSPTLTETSAKKKKSQKLTLSDSISINKNVSLTKTPKDSEKKKETKDSSDEKSDASPSSASKGKKRISMGGVILEDLVIGTGATAVKGKKVSVYYEGKLKNGKVFDKVKSGGYFKFKLGANDVIKAWDIGVVGMQVGGKRKITAPPGMAYGKNGCPPKIPPNSVLTFEVELKGVN